MHNRCASDRRLCLVSAAYIVCSSDYALTSYTGRNVVFIMASCYEWCIIKIVFARKGVNMNHDGGKLLCKHHINVCVRCENVLQIYLKYNYGARSNMRRGAMRRGTHSHTRTHTYYIHVHIHAHITRKMSRMQRVRILHLFSNHCKIN